MAIKKYWNFANEASVPSDFNQIEGGNGAVSINSDHLRLAIGGVALGDYAAAVLNTELDTSKLTVIYGECKFSGATGAWVPNLIGLMDSDGVPVAMTAANRDASLRIWQEYQLSSGADDYDRIQLRKKNASGSQWNYVADNDTWTSSFIYTRSYYDEGSYYRFVIILDGTVSPMRARSLVYGYTEGAGGWLLNYDSSWRDFDTASDDIDPVDNDLWVVIGDLTNNETKSAQVIFDFRRIMIAEVDVTELNEIAFTNKGGGIFPFDYDLFKYINPMPDDQTLWVPREREGHWPGGPDTDTPEIVSGDDDWVKDPVCFFDGTTYWLFYQRRDGTTSDSEIFVSSTTDILNGTWSNETLISSPASGEVKHEFPWVMKYGGTWYLVYGVESDTGPTWEIQYKTTTASSPTSGWSSATTLLDVAGSGEFDDDGCTGAVLVWYSGTFTDGTWYLIYGGNNDNLWKGGLAKSTTGILGTYSRVGTPLLLNTETFSTQLSANHANASLLTVDSTVDLSVGDWLYVGSPATIIEVLSVDSSTTFTIQMEINASNNEYVRAWSYHSVVPRILRRINGYWIIYTSTFKFSANGEECVGIYVDITGNTDLEDCSFRQMRVGENPLDLVIPVVQFSETSNENLGPIVEALSGPVIVDTNDLTAVGIITTPVVGAPFIGQTHILNVTGTTVMPVVGTPSIGQTHILTALGITTTPVVGTPVISQTHILIPLGIATTPVVGTPVISQTHILTPLGIVTTPVVGTPVIGQTYILNALGITTIPVVGTPVIGETHNLGAIGVLVMPQVGIPALGQTYVLSALSIQTTPIIGSPIIGDAHALTAVGIVTTPVVGVPSSVVIEGLLVTVFTIFCPKVLAVSLYQPKINFTIFTED